MSGCLGAFPDSECADGALRTCWSGTGAAPYRARAAVQVKTSCATRTDDRSMRAVMQYREPAWHYLESGGYKATQIRKFPSTAEPTLRFRVSALAQALELERWCD